MNTTMFEQLTNAYLMTGMQNLISTGESILGWAQAFGLIAAALAFCIGGYYLILGGDRGRSKSIGWFIGSAVGLVIVMGAYALAQGVDENISFVIYFNL